MTDIFGKITSGIDKSIKTIGSKSKEFLESTRLKGDIKDTNVIIQSKFQALGKKTYEMLNRGLLNEDELRFDCAGIAELFKKITELEDAIKKIELEALRMQHGSDAVVCSKCRAPNNENGKFCMSCGAALNIEVRVEGNLCPACGAKAKEGAKFCVRCGGKM